jgi:medium-chain acyl-[acyl-carrier-protein] hydrolase
MSRHLLNFAQQRRRDFMLDPEFLAELREYGGAPEEIFREPELMELLLPVLRADFQVIDAWEHVTGEPLIIPIATIGGIDGRGTSRQHLDAWRVQTQRDLVLHPPLSDHFFIQSAARAALSIVSQW